MFSTEQAETASIRTLDTFEDMTNLMRMIKHTPKRLVEGEGPLGQSPRKLHLRMLPGYQQNPAMALGVTLGCSYGSEPGYMLAVHGDTVVTYTDGTFCILPTGTPARVAPPSFDELYY